MKKESLLKIFSELYIKFKQKNHKINSNNYVFFPIKSVFLKKYSWPGSKSAKNEIDPKHWSEPRTILSWEHFRQVLPNSQIKI